MAFRPKINDYFGHLILVIITATIITSSSAAATCFLWYRKGSVDGIHVRFPISIEIGPHERVSGFRFYRQHAADALLAALRIRGRPEPRKFRPAPAVRHAKVDEHGARPLALPQGIIRIVGIVRIVMGTVKSFPFAW